MVADKIKALLGDVNAEMERTKQQLNVAERLQAIYEEAKRLVGELSHSDDGKKARPRTRRKNKP